MELEPPQALENRALQKFPTDLWAWPTDAEVEQWAYRGTGRAGLDDLETALADYLKRPWLQHDAIDISAINALIIAEMAERFLDVKTGAALGKANWSFIFSGGNIFAETGLAFAGKIFGFLAAWVLVPALAIGLLVQVMKWERLSQLVFGLSMLCILIMIPVRWRARKFKEKIATTVADRLTAIVKAWHAARGHTINPSRLKELVLVAEERGAIFPSVLHTIIDRAISRDATALFRHSPDDPRLDGPPVPS